MQAKIVFEDDQGKVLSEVTLSEAAYSEHREVTQITDYAGTVIELVPGQDITVSLTGKLEN